MARLGADVAAVEELSRRFTRDGQELGELRTLVDAAMSSTWWVGSRSDAFRGDWRASMRPALATIADRLQQIGRDLAGQAQQQREASDGLVGTGGVALGRVPGPGDAGGMDPSALDEHNRAAIQDEIDRLRAAQERLDPGIDWWFIEDDADRHDALQERIDSLEDIQASLTDEAHVLAFSPDGDGRAVVAYGDLTTAEHVAVNVPGIGNDLDNYAGFLTRASNLRGASAQAYGEDVATVAWLGYDTPGSFSPGDLEWETLEAPLSRRSDEAAVDLAAFLDDVRATNPDAHTSVIGHSYGSNVAADALRAEGMAVDDYVFVGSPGVGVDHVDDLGAPAGSTVWAESVGTFGDRPAHDPTGVKDAVNRWVGGGDPVPSLPSTHGGNPDHPDFGARGFALGDASGHSQYYTPGSAGHDGRALDSLAAIASGHDPRPPEDGS